MNASAIVGDMLRRAAGDLPPSWCDPQTREPNAATREELAWSLLLHMLVHLLFRDPLPNAVRVGREHRPFTIDETTWRDFEAEFGLGMDGARRELTERLASILRREPPSVLPSQSALPRLAAGLVCLLDGLSRHGRGARRSAPRHVSLGFDGAASCHDDPAALVDDLISWAGQAGAMPEDRYRIVFHVLWRPLSRRSWGESVAPIGSDPPKLSLPADFLLTARASQVDPPGTLSATDMTAADLDSASSRHLSGQRVSPPDVDAQEVLAILLEPLLMLRGDPAASVVEAEAKANGFIQDMLRAWRRLLLAGDLRLFGQPGMLLDLDLPDRAWELARGPFRSASVSGPRRVRVVRRGVLLRGEVLLRGTVIIEGRQGGDAQ